MEYSYEEFVEEFRQLLLAMTGYGEERIYFKVEKDEPITAGDRLFVICSENDSRKEVCGLHTRDLYEQYKEGTPMEILLKEVMEQMHRLKRSGIIGKALDLDSYEKVRDSLCIRLLNHKKYAWDLEDAIYRKLGDLAVVLYMVIGESDGILTTMKIRDSMMEEWDVDEDTAFEAAILNSFRQAPPRFYPWKKWIENPGYRGEAFLDLVNDYPLNRSHSGNCLSTSKKTNGAVAIFYPGVADRIAQLLSDSFYMVFTSVHEVMIHCESESDSETLRRVLRDTITVATADEDFLTYNIYHYDKEERKFSIVN